MRAGGRTAITLAAATLILATGCPQPAHVRESWPAFGDTLSAELYMASEDDATDCLKDIRSQVAAFEAEASPENGELARLNAGAADAYYKIQNADLYRAIRLAFDYAQYTRGAYDPTVGPLVRLYGRGSGRVPTPTEIQVVLEQVGWDKVVMAPEAHALRFSQPGMALDLGPLGRGAALDIGARSFARPGAYGALLTLGNSELIWGNPPGQDRWAAPLADPRSRDRTFLTLHAENRGVAMAGHPDHGMPEIFDASTGRPASSNVIVAVAVADSAADAAGLATALFVGGSAKGGDLLGRMIRAEAVMLVEGNGEPELLVSASLEGLVDVSPELEAEVGGRIRYILPPETIDLESPLRQEGS